MNGINLLPWRAGRERQKNRQLIYAAMAFWALSLSSMFFVYQQSQFKLGDQQARIDYLNHEISKVNQQIKDLKQLHIDRDALLSRIDIIQQLQFDRQQIVHVFDDIVRKLPEGVAIDTLKKNGEALHLTGRAKSNSRVTELMNQLDSSDWFGESSLNLVRTPSDDEVALSQFDMSLQEKSPTPIADNTETGTGVVTLEQGQATAQPTRGRAK